MGETGVGVITSNHQCQNALEGSHSSLGTWGVMGGILVLLIMLTGLRIGLLVVLLASLGAAGLTWEDGLREGRRGGGIGTIVGRHPSVVDTQVEMWAVVVVHVALSSSPLPLSTLSVVEVNSGLLRVGGWMPGVAM